MPAFISTLALSHRRLVAGLWIALTLAGAWAASGLSDHLSPAFDAPGKPAFETSRELAQRFGSGGSIAPIVAVSRDGDVDSLRLVAAAVRGGRSVVGGPALTGSDGRTVAALIFPPPGRADPAENPEALTAAQSAARGSDVQITGQQALAGGGESGGAGLLVETLLGAGGALIVLVVVFASALAIVPLLLAAVSILTTFLVLRGLAAGFEMSIVVQFLVGLIGLGVSIDYSLLLIVRWREERDQGADPERAVRRALETAGHAILVSGTTVAIGLVAMVAVPVPFIRSIGVGGLLIPLISVAATLTLLPGVLASFGPRLDRRRTRRPARSGAGWSRWSQAVVRRRWPAALAGLAITGALAVAALGLNPGQPSVDALAGSGPAHDGLVALQQAGLSTGTLTPIEAVVPAGQAATAAKRLAQVPGVRAVLGQETKGWTAGGLHALAVVPREDAATDAGKATLDALRGLHSDTLRIGGPAAQDRDLTEAIYGSFPLVFGLIALLTFALLYLALRSVVLPIKAILLNVLSVAAAFGIVVLIWQEGLGSDLLAGVPGTGAITNWVPLAIFAFLYGLSMDYEVFILSRMREEYERLGDTDEAIVEGLTRTGRLVTSAALILFLAFIALGAGPQTDLKMLATGLAAGIVLDATIVRALLVPSLMSLLGKANWWAPRKRPPVPAPITDGTA